MLANSLGISPSISVFAMLNVISFGNEPIDAGITPFNLLLSSLNSLSSVNVEMFGCMNPSSPISRKSIVVILPLKHTTLVESHEQQSMVL